jgi:hypothetical protein
MNLATLRYKGFDESSHIPFTKSYRVKCSSCQACSINGVACHEQGCPNQTYECNGCNTLLTYRGYCAECQ